MEVREIEKNTFVIQFYHWMDKSKVVNGQPWHFDRHAIILADITGNMKPSDVQCYRFPMWVRVYNLPFKGRSNEANIKNVAKKLGELVARRLFVTKPKYSIEKIKEEEVSNIVEKLQITERPEVEVEKEKEKGEAEVILEHDVAVQEEIGEVSGRGESWKEREGRAEGRESSQLNKGEKEGRNKGEGGNGLGRREKQLMVVEGQWWWWDQNG
ncbi:Translation initiation factor IF-2 [Bienertia sinuspersici]